MNVEEKLFVNSLKHQIQLRDKEIERLNNIIDELDMMLKTLIFESEFSSHKVTAHIILMNLNKLRGFDKGADKDD